MTPPDLSRRQFLTTAALAAAGITIAPPATSGAPAYLKGLGKPNSLFNGVQIGVISYSWRSMPGSAEQILQYCIDSNISAIELMGTPAEIFAGARRLLPHGWCRRPGAGQLTNRKPKERSTTEKWRHGGQVPEWKSLSSCAECTTRPASGFMLSSPVHWA